MKTTLAFTLLLLLSTDLMAEEIAVTVYNSNLGVVSETRTLRFEKGLTTIPFRDVPSAIDANSVRFEVVGSGSSVTILEQNYAYDLVSSDRIYSRYIDNEIELIDEKGQLFVGKLMAFSAGTVTLQDRSGGIKVVRLDKVTEVNFPELPEGLVTKPTLFWLCQSSGAGERECNVSYQTSGINWTAEYVGLLDSDEKRLDLSGWAAINNTSGKTYNDATLKLIAGDIHRATPDRFPRGMKSMSAEMATSAGFDEKAFFEYHLYTLPRKATLANREIKQISLFDPAQTNVTKIFRYRPDRNPTAVQVAIKFTNSASAGLGMPLPAGRLRLFKADDDGSLILLGEDRIKHTPADEELTVTVGTAFDIVAEQRMVDQRRISQQVDERDWEIEIRNRKTEPVIIQVEKRLGGNWEILNSNIEYIKKDAYTIRFEIMAEAGEKVVASFTVRTRR